VTPALRLDVVTIFPDYLAPLQLSLIGKAIRDGLVTLGVHDLRAWTDDRHHTVDDAPFGGGAGMVMRPEPWGRALDEVAGPDTVLVIPTPSGQPFTQDLADNLAGESHLVFACGRYEGIDGRVVEDARRRMRVVETSLGDYVLNGGEVAVLAIIEAVVRLVPGVIGNPDSLVAESHAREHEALLEGPSYTRPAVWRDLAVPEELLSGDHARIATWRRTAALERTRERRPDLLGDGHRGWQILPARPVDAGELLTVQRAAFADEARIVGSPHIPPLLETQDEIAQRITAAAGGEEGVWVARVDDGERPGRIVGAVRGAVADDDPAVWVIGRLCVAPDQRSRGVGRALMTAAQDAAPASCRTFRLIAAQASVANQAFYRRLGYRAVGTLADAEGIELVVMTARRRV